MIKVKSMRMKIIGIVALLFFLFFDPLPLYASDKGLTAFSVLKFAGGMVAAFSLHEGGHALAGLLTDTEMDWELGTYNQPILFLEKSDKSNDGFIINSAGFVVQAVSAEAILQVDRIDKNDAFVRGMMTWNILNPILYALDYWFFHLTSRMSGGVYQGDLQGLEYYSDETTADIIAAAITVTALFQSYRYIKSQSWAPAWFSGNTRGLQLLPLSAEGLLLKYRFRF